MFRWHSRALVFNVPQLVECNHFIYLWGLYSAGCAIVQLRYSNMCAFARAILVPSLISSCEAGRYILHVVRFVLCKGVKLCV